MIKLISLKTTRIVLDKEKFITGLRIVLVIFLGMLYCAPIALSFMPYYMIDGPVALGIAAVFFVYWVMYAAYMAVTINTHPLQLRYSILFSNKDESEEHNQLSTALKWWIFFNRIIAPIFMIVSMWIPLITMVISIPSYDPLSPSNTQLSLSSTYKSYVLYGYAVYIMIFLMTLSGIYCFKCETVKKPADNCPV
jgi:hypothetical protein